jgi:hypothetical protein
MLAYNVQQAQTKRFTMKRFQNIKGVMERERDMRNSLEAKHSDESLESRRDD